MARKLDAMENLKARTFAASKKRKVGDAIDDPISETLALAQKPSEMADLALNYGIPQSIIDEKAEKAPNLGQFRMTLGNMIRGSIARKERFETKTKTTVEYKDVATKKAFAAKMAEFRKANRPVKDGSKVKTPKAKAEKKGGKDATKSEPVKRVTKKRVKGLDGVERDIEYVDDAPKGAPSKTEAAKRGRGGKRKAAKSAEVAALAGRVDDAGGETGGQAELADQVAATNA
jgi:hypothetical protein